MENHRALRHHRFNAVNKLYHFLRKFFFSLDRPEPIWASFGREFRPQGARKASPLPEPCSISFEKETRDAIDHDPDCKKTEKCYVDTNAIVASELRLNQRSEKGPEAAYELQARSPPSSRGLRDPITCARRDRTSGERGALSERQSIPKEKGNPRPLPDQVSRCRSR